MTKIKLIDFYSDTCVPCKQMMPVLDDLQEMYGSHIEIEKVNVADNKDKVEQFGVMGVPSIFLYIDDELVHFGKGFQSLDMLNDKIEEELEAHE